MKHLKLYTQYFESLEILDDIITTNPDNKKWDISEPGIKIFFDITPYNDPSQTPYGKLLIMANTMKDLELRYKEKNWKNTLTASTHVGFIFSDGRILHATSEFYSKEKNGVKYESVNSEHVQDIINNPKFYVIFNIGGNEKDIIKIGNSIIKKLIKAGTYGKSYDWRGIKRIFKSLDNVLDVKNDKVFNQGIKDNDYYYCSEFVAYILTELNLITLDDIKNIRSDNETNETKYDINPTELYEIVSKIGKKLKFIK